MIPPNISDNRDKNRYCKMHGYKIFPQYDYTIYIDGYCGLGMARHPFRDCVFEEGIAVVAAGKSDETEIKKLLHKYANEGMPRNFGLFECGILVCDTSNRMGIDILESWYEEYMSHHLRDQLSLPYVLWKKGLPLRTIGIVDGGRNSRQSEIARLELTHKNH